MQTELGDEWNPMTGHLKVCKSQKNKHCVGKNINGSPCKNPQSSCAQSCDLGTGSYCAVHYKKYLFKNNDPQLSTCANIRCDDLNVPREAREKINQHNIKRVLGLSGDNHISNSRFKRFDYGAFEDFKFLVTYRADSDHSDVDEEFTKYDSESETDIDSDEIDSEEEGRVPKRKRNEKEVLPLLPTKRYRIGALPTKVSRII
jgi:hypothetical protein